MKNLSNLSIKANRLVKFLIKALVQIAFFIMVIGFFDYIFVSLDLSRETPKIIIYVEAFALFLLSRISKIIVDIFRAYIKSKNPKDNDSNEDEDIDKDDDENDEDLFWLSK